MTGDRIATEVYEQYMKFPRKIHWSRSSPTVLSLYASFGNELNSRRIH